MIELTWDEFAAAAPRDSGHWATSDRGWASETPTARVSCASYVDYTTASPDYFSGPDLTKPISVIAYHLYVDDNGLCQSTRVGEEWVATIAEAKAWATTAWNAWRKETA